MEWLPAEPRILSPALLDEPRKQQQQKNNHLRKTIGGKGKQHQNARSPSFLSFVRRNLFLVKLSLIRE